MNALVHFDSLPRPDVWAASAAHTQVSYTLQADAEPDTVCRILNLFALQSLTPHSIQLTQQHDMFAVQIDVGGLSWHRAQLIAQKMRNLVCVAEVSLQGSGKIL